MPGGLEPDGDEDVQQDIPVDDEFANPPNRHPNIQKNVSLGVNSDFLRVFSDMARSFNFNASDIAFIGAKVPTTNDLASWGVCTNYLVRKLSAFPGFQAIFHTNAYCFPFNDPEDLNEMQLDRQKAENDLIDQLFMDQHLKNSNIRPGGTNLPITLPQRASLIRSCQEFARTPVYSEQMDLDLLLSIANCDAQVAYIKRYINLQYAARINWLSATLADTIRHSNNSEVKLLLTNVPIGYFHLGWYKFVHHFHPAVVKRFNLEKDTFAFFPMLPKETVEQYAVRLDVRRNTYARNHGEDIGDEKMRTALMIAVSDRPKLRDDLTTEMQRMDSITYHDLVTTASRLESNHAQSKGYSQMVSRMQNALNPSSSSSATVSADVNAVSSDTHSSPRRDKDSKKRVSGGGSNTKPTSKRSDSGATHYGPGGTVVP